MYSVEVELSEEALAGFFAAVLPELAERDRRRVLGEMAVALGRGGQARVVAASSMSSSTVLRAVKEARGEIDVPDDGRQRQPGGGTKSVIDRQPGVLSALDDLVWPEARGHPMSPLRY